MLRTAFFSDKERQASFRIVSSDGERPLLAPE